MSLTSQDGQELGPVSKTPMICCKPRLRGPDWHVDLDARRTE
jgi:hypothetical protein